jgi:predicted TIM-barrel fold metal-dependent hydrolase
MTRADTAPLCLPPQVAKAPRQRLPVGSTDCHCHVYEPGTEARWAPGRSYTPSPAGLQAYLGMCEALGITRTVQVNASIFGLDNTPTSQVLRALGPARARGVAGIDAASVTDAELQQLHDEGFRGVRLSTHVKGYGGTDALATTAKRIAPWGWHVQVHVAHGHELAELEPMLRDVNAPLVFDHLGCVRGGEGVQSAGFQALLRLLQDRDDRWVKVSSFYRRSDAGAPDYADMAPLVQALVQARADRVLFGTNWPHPNLFAPEAVPDDGHLADLFCQWVPDEAQRHAILVRNPERLYGFEPA